MSDQKPPRVKIPTKRLKKPKKPARER